jgi:ABC-type multidrug transport system fused ATPase/permease subunit
MIGLLVRLYPLVRASGLRRLGAIVALMLLQAVMQTVAVFSLIPLLSAASDIDAFRRSRVGGLFAEAIGGGSDQRLLVWAGLISLAVLVLGNLVALVADYARNRYANRIAHRLRLRLLAELLERRYEYFLGINSSILLKVLVEDIGLLAGQLIAPALDVVARGLLVAFLVALVLAVEPWIVVGGAIVVALYYVAVMRPVRDRAEATSDALNRDVRALYFQISQILSGIKPILATGRNRPFIARAEQASERFSAALSRIPMFATIPRSGLEIVVFGGMIAWLLIAILGGTDLVALVPRLGVVAVVAYRLMPSLQLLFAQVGAMNAARQALDEVTALLAEQERFAARAPGSAGEPAEPLHWEREIAFENVSFAYAGADEPVLHDISFTLSKGRRVAFVGPTGAGKSTLIDLLLGLLEPTGGRILIDGEPLTAATTPAWRRGVGYVPQELFLLDATIAENIAFGETAEGLDRHRVGEVAELAQAREFIESGRAAGLDSVVGERGVRLSGGQRQRLALARALYGRPNLLVMDEATSALDTATEQKVVAALAAAHEELTVVTVTHRLATVRDYDTIHYVEAGRIVASGDYATLAASHAAFAEVAR